MHERNHHDHCKPYSSDRLGPQLYSALTFKKIKLGDMPAVIRAGTLVDLDDVVRLVARLADVPLEVACAIDPEDIAPVLTAMTAHISQHMPTSI